MQGVGPENFLCLIPESLSMLSTLARANEGMGEGQSIL